MPKFREFDEDDDDIEDLEFPFHERPMTLEERDAFIKKYCSVDSSHRPLEDIEHSLRDGRITFEEREKTLTKIRPKDHIESSETDEPKSLTSTPEKDHIHHRGSPREIRIRTPKIRGQEILSPEELESNISSEFSGIMERDDFTSLFDVAVSYIKLMNALAGKQSIKRADLVEISKDLDIELKRAEDLVFNGRRPLLFRLLKFATSQSELDILASGFRKKLNGLRTAA